MWIRSPDPGREKLREGEQDEEGWEEPHVLSESCPGFES